MSNGKTMPRGPKGEKRPRDTNQLAKLMVDILTGQVEDRERTPEERGVDPAASAMGKKGGLEGRLRVDMARSPSRPSNDRSLAHCRRPPRRPRTDEIPQRGRYTPWF